MGGAVWHEYPEDIPNGEGPYLVTVNYEGKLRVYLDYFLMNSLFVFWDSTFSHPIAWAETTCLEWHDYPNDKPKKDGLYILRDKGSERIFYADYSTEAGEFDLDMPFPMVEWAETLEPYKEGQVNE